jgi:ABC-type transporter Mla subunit MlaD
MAEADEIRETADRRVGDTLARADAALESAAGLRRDLQPVLSTAQATLHDADRTVADLHPQLLGLVAASKVTAGETAQTMRDFRNAVPNFLAQGQRITANVNTATSEFSGVATNLNRLTKPKWYDRLLGYGLNGVVIYRDLNPVTSLTLKGAQFLTSH